MIDASEVESFAQRLNSTPNTFVEEGWKSEWSEKVADEMRSFAPVDTGKLRDSIETTSEGVEVGAEYGVYVERGTSDTAPQPFTVPAINRLIGDSARDAGDRVILELT